MSGRYQLYHLCMQECPARLYWSIFRMGTSRVPHFLLRLWYFFPIFPCHPTSHNWGTKIKVGGGEGREGKLNWLNLCQALKDDSGDISLYRDSFWCIWRWMQPGDLSSFHAQLFIAISKDLAVLYSRLWTKRKLRKVVKNSCQSGQISLAGSTRCSTWGRWSSKPTDCALNPPLMYENIQTRTDCTHFSTGISPVAERVP